MNNKQLLVAFSLALSFGTHAQGASGASSEDHTAHHPAAPAGSAPAAAPLVDGEVRKVDREQGKLTLRHGPLPTLDMPGMTMVFRVVDPQMLEAVKQGDQVRFSAERLDGAFTVTAIEQASR